eukprot:2819993-Amphidinium_carterae.1
MLSTREQGHGDCSKRRCLPKHSAHVELHLKIAKAATLEQACDHPGNIQLLKSLLSPIVR